jgi:hypothetical protein
LRDRRINIGGGDCVDIGLALTHVTKDPQWVKKVLIGGLLLLIPIIGGMIVYGFGIRIARNVINGLDQPMPEWDDIGGDLGRGFFAIIGIIIWALPIWVLAICSQVLGSTSDAMSALALFVNLCLVLPLYLLFAAFILPTIIGRFAATGEFGSMLQFNDVITSIRSAGFGPYLMFLVLWIVASIIAGLGLIACFIGVLFTSAYAQYALAHGIGQLQRRSQSMTVGIPATEHPAF